jgi:hypothetical protein
MLEPNERGECIAHMTKSVVEGRSPGPAAYRVRRHMDKPETPTITMRVRTNIPEEHNEAPYYKVPSSFGKVTSVKMHARCDPGRRDATPGPSYMPPPFGSGAHKKGFAAPGHGTGAASARRARSDQTPLGRRRGPDETPGPGPGAYSTRTRDFQADGQRGPRFKAAHDLRWADPETPGPAAYKPKHEKVLPAAPRYTMHVRTKLRGREDTPGYRNIGSTLAGPKWTMKARAADEVMVI